MSSPVRPIEIKRVGATLAKAVASFPRRREPTTGRTIKRWGYAACIDRIGEPLNQSRATDENDATAYARALKPACFRRLS
jgi:hypothetical protein